MFDGIVNGTLSEKVSITGVILNSHSFVILLIHTKHKTIRWNFGLIPMFYSREGELTQYVDKAKNVWLIVGQLP